ncbi:hypothetical protein DFH09DRAFT_217605 [Mycena vulgaris]|nr:hypothetical protein DFH09DRAFT_217605 [Mycena vulgaris]
MTSNSPPAKRQRIENAPITRSDIWYEDGSVVLTADNTQFRVHWSILAQHSTFFRDLQGLPQPPDQPSVEGCPVVELPDALADVENLLRALYNPTFLFKKVLPFRVVAALIRMGRKYEFRDILDSAVDRITFENPSTIGEYEALKDRNGQYAPTRFLGDRSVIFDILTLARENNIQSALPCAYFRALIYHTRQQLFDGVSRENGDLSVLAPIDLRRCILAREQLLKAQWETGNTLECVKSRLSYPDCPSELGCGASRQRLVDAYLLSMPLRAFPPTTFVDDLDVCAACKKHMKFSVAAGRKKMWKQLPSFFELPPWDELKNDL